MRPSSEVDDIVAPAARLWDVAYVDQRARYSDRQSVRKANFPTMTQPT